MNYEIVMPQLGMTMTEGLLLKWLKAPGDPVAKGEPVAEIQTDKVDIEVESPYEGFLVEIQIQEGLTVPVGTQIGRIAKSLDAAGPIAAPLTTTAQAAPTTDSTESAAAPPRPQRRDGPRISPLARRVANEHQVDLNQISGTGEWGRIREADVRAYLSRRPVEPMVAKEDASGRIRKIIADRLTASVTTIPQYWLSREVDASPMVAMRHQLLPAIIARTGVRLSFTDFFLKALAYGLERCPEMKQRWTDERLESVEETGIGFAAQAPGRLLVPVISNAGRRSLAEIASERFRLASKALEGRLTGEDMHGACGTLSNLGAFGVDEFQAIINPPESFILAIGRIAERPFAINGQLAARPTVRLVLTVDHRVADGVAGARFLSQVVEALESPIMLLV